ncbi:hypothetical protein LF599_14035 [Pseudodesulfovibrio thermohalotolerans]|uniref:hypothetical protein n=1 Tax=Pseudodesulfovibrio thermohalotolerans TaxID=2880651 RepID=UPI002442788C|nr:hypothetical protein [Pseudodesulfovibrio thermohalotolerans]WFS61782.1 hypothetical protein LF599_14035 [Pseudodesulfovibrio thermohalotolerans]
MSCENYFHYPYSFLVVAFLDSPLCIGCAAQSFWNIFSSTIRYYYSINLARLPEQPTLPDSVHAGVILRDRCKGVCAFSAYRKGHLATIRKEYEMDSIGCRLKKCEAALPEIEDNQTPEWA